MANALAILDTNMPAIPAELQQFWDEESNVAPKATTPTLSYGGKIWTIGIDGEKTKLMKREADTGDETPISVMRVVVLDYNKRRGRAYYEGAYDPNEVKMPLCWSDDGIKPDDSVTQKQHPQCEGCPMSIKGSKVSDNNKGTVACAQHRMVAVVPAGKNLTLFPPLRLKLAITSDWDKDRAVDDGYMAFQQYTDYLRGKKVPHTAMLVTKLKFDPTTDYPKVLFSVDKWLDPQTEMPIVKKLVKSEEVKKLLGGHYTPNGIDGTEKPKQIGSTTDTSGGGADPDEAAAKAASEAKAAAALKAATDKDAADKAAAKAAAKAKKKAEADAAAAAAQAAADAAAKAAVDDDDEDAEIVLAGSPAAAAAEKATPVNGAAAPATKAPAVVAAKASEVPSDVEKLLKEWGD